MEENQKLQQIYGIHNDKIELLDNIDIPLCKNAVYALCGCKGSGKTTLQNKIVKTMRDRNNKLNQYSLDNPFIITNAPITNTFLLSFTANCDLSTFLNADTKTKTIVSLKDNPDAMNDFIDNFYMFNDTIVQTLKLQCQARFNLKSKYIQEKILLFTQQRRKRVDDQEIDLLFQVCEQVQLIKQKYQYLRVKETDPNVMRYMTMLYQLYQKHWDGYWLRRHSVIIQIEDSSAMNFISGASQTNRFTQFLTITRHIGVYALLINIHEITLIQGQRRSSINNFILLKGLKIKQVEDLFQAVGLDNKYFDQNKFIEEYQKNSGHDQPTTQGAKFKYNFTYILTEPEKRIYLNFDKRIY
ncbi:Conserved_hypothetical protein [Hexamita inflata]|uniref:Uncharacterized protein n=1 Tax=Hexamita inflata TaxID=28002 RepID=A0AA86QUI5_9EUKA|nr:Conserved hypothetical protein [Hexamita inflata]